MGTCTHLRSRHLCHKEQAALLIGLSRERQVVSVAPFVFVTTRILQLPGSRRLQELLDHRQASIQLWRCNGDG
jgi:hypothetical protein